MKIPMETIYSHDDQQLWDSALLLEERVAKETISITII